MLITVLDRIGLNNLKGGDIMKKRDGNEEGLDIRKIYCEHCGDFLGVWIECNFLVGNLIFNGGVSAFCGCGIHFYADEYGNFTFRGFVNLA
jgi:hypothetical protein